MATKKLGFGFMRLPLLDSEEPGSIDLEQVKKMVDAFLARGFTYFDTAWMYHAFKSELAVREALVKRHARDTFTLATKLPTMMLRSEEEQEEIFNQQLEKCGVDYFDYYLLHNLGKENYETAERFHSFAFVQKKKKEGKIRHAGFSFHDNAELLDEILTAHPEAEFVQLQLNYLDWDNESIQSRKCYETARRHGKPVVVMEPIKGGTLAKLPEKAEKLLQAAEPDMTTPSWAIRFAASHEGVRMVLSGMSDYAQLMDNTDYMQDFKPFTAEEFALVKQTVNILNESIAVPCTSCQYCVKGCPKNIPIPKYFALYNTEMQSIKLPFSAQSVYYRNFSQRFAKASDCIGCRQCERACPQHIEITKWLKEVVKTFEK